MKDFTEEHAKTLLNNEWLVKVDPSKSIPYLFKYHFSLAELSCYIMVTDTKSVWVEVLNSKQLARRWRSCNALSPEPLGKTGDEYAWKERTLQLLSNGHTMGGMTELSFEGVEARFSDLAFELECEAFKWRWETCFLGHQRSSEIILKHLIFPLMSLTHLTFSSAQSISELSDTDLEQSVDILSRTARRTIDNHIKNALSKPRVGTSIRRMTAMFNFIPDPKPITSIAEKPLLEVEQVEAVEIYEPPTPAPKQKEADSSPKQKKSSPKKTPQKREHSVDMKAAQPDSETESDSEPAEPKQTTGTSILQAAGPSRTSEQSSPNGLSKEPTPPPASPRISRSRSTSNSESSPRRPAKKTKPAVMSSSDDDSNQDNMKSRGASAAATSGANRGTRAPIRQPLKRGGKRF